MDASDGGGERLEVELCGGPLDGMRFPVSAGDLEGDDAGAAMLCDSGPYGLGGRAWYGPREGEPRTRWHLEGYSA